MKKPVIFNIIKPSQPTLSNQLTIQNNEPIKSSQNFQSSQNNQPLQSPQNNYSFQTAEVSGIINYVEFAKGNSNTTNFKIHCVNIKRTFDAVCDFYCPIRKDDIIYAFCKVEPNNRLVLIKPPFVQPPMDKESVVQCFMKSLKQGFQPAIKTYNTVSKIAEGDHNVIPFLTQISQQWNDTHNQEILNMFSSIDSDEIKKLLTWWHKERNLRRLYLFGLTKKEINTCRMTCDEIYETCMKNPYIIPGLSMQKCNDILDRLNKKPVENEKIKGEIIRVLYKNQNEFGYSGTPTKFLVKQFPNIKDHVESLKHDYGMVADMETAYLKFPYKVETWIAEYIINKCKKDLIKYDSPLETKIVSENGDVTERISAIFTKPLSEEQQKAVQGALDHTLCIITGGAGVGKTLVLGQIVHNLELRGTSYAVCSFTGKAVARIREVTKKRNPSTIHRLIANAKTNPTDKRSKQFEKDIPPAEYDHIIIDEVSMVTSELLYDFLEAYPTVKKLTLIGDTNQLQPISWGSLFSQMIKSETIPTYCLTTNFRVYNAQGERDGIILNANAIITHDSNYPFEIVETNNFSLIEGPIERVFDILKGCFSSGVKPDQLVVICPFNRYLEVLNRTFQSIYNVGARSIKDSRGVIWMIGDRVMLTENDQEIGVFNGESGTIRDISDKAILVDFSSSGCHEFLLEPTYGKTNSYGQPTSTPYWKRGKNMDEVLDNEEYISDERTVMKLAHSYALTVDKSQGSEWDFVIFFIPEFTNGSFLNKNRLYTAWTRSKRACWTVTCDNDSLNNCAVKIPTYRCDNLAKRLKLKLPNLPQFKIKTAKPELDMVNDMIPEETPDFGYDPDDDF